MWLNNRDYKSLILQYQSTSNVSLLCVATCWAEALEINSGFTEMDPGELGKLFRLFLGLPTDRPPLNRNNHHDENQEDAFHPRDQVSGGEDRGRRSFTVFTDPLEIHRFFEQQMDDMLRSFGQGLGGLGGGGAIMMDPSEDDRSSCGSVRDFMLKDEGNVKHSGCKQWPWI